LIRKAIETARLLVVSHDTAILRPLWVAGEANCWEFESASNAWEAIERVQSGMTPHLLLLDLPRGDADALHVLRWFRRLRPTLPIVLIGYSDDNGKREEAIRMGARDYLVRPVDDGQLELVIQQHLSGTHQVSETEIMSEDVEQVSNDNFFIGISPIMRKLRAQASLLAEANFPVLILGESGSGKKTTARLLHKLSVRSGFEFARVNCAALPSDLLERELFGHHRDGAISHGQAKAGKLELCAKGTIFLAEITEMSMDLQANLLQVLVNKRFTRPGTSVDVDVRILAASSANMEHAVSENRLREDLYYRLSAYTIHVPPLRERREEIPLLSRHFMHHLARHYGLSPREFSPAIIDACQSYAWPGNLRELEDFVKRYLMVGDRELAFEKSRSNLDGTDEITAQTNPRRLTLLTPSLGHSDGVANSSDSLKALVQSVKLEAEKNAIAAALEKTGWNRKAAARLLKVSYRTLLYKIEQYQMNSSDASLFPGNGFRNRGTGFRGSGGRNETN
jgi:two-component system, NtrC family, response regulator AtoC